ncbi:hypothetical protein CCACVL1_26784 [Corchorus capsularis]|uniref:Uncharacterized protein n=1 Tax=Corchorus capsularis TaxID=210143 RepID=A0A1R3GDC4_COCAP|nr:hypothetical protein CCACVL1_26784 [Corchorus capsularis]
MARREGQDIGSNSTWKDGQIFIKQAIA